METVLNFVYNNILSILMIVLLITGGAFLTIKTQALQFRRFGYSFRSTLGTLFDKSLHTKQKGSVSPFQAVTTALAGTIGTGSIAGIATALVAGGPGAVFWMWISALLGMITKYSEIVLSVHYREKNQAGEWVGGPMYYIKKGLKSKWLAFTFALFAMIACFGIGNTTQSNAISGVIQSSLNVPTWITGLVTMAIVALVTLGGIKRIASVNEKIVPAMAIFYILCAIVVLVIKFDKIPQAFALIFKEAFNLKSAFGGVAGYGILTAMRFGVGRGVFTNEAGLGSAPIAHSATSETDPVKQGWWGMFEVFVTTIIICTISALVILTSDAYAGIYQAVDMAPTLNGAALSSKAFNEAIPHVGEYGVAIATVFFSLSTILGWAYYGEVCVGYIFSKHRKVSVLIYRLVFVAFIFLGAVAKIEIVWLVADCCNVLMAVPNLVALFALAGMVKKLTDKHFEKKDSLLDDHALNN
ncbi:MAG: sodium:alanine symporter family protein [Clostridia bacterium]|nr:sodium:alanine symporter family protein [Clostridia bacterium]